MANRRALWINSGSVTQLATTDGLLAAELDVTSGNLTLGGTNASAILLGTNIDKDAAEALVIGGTNATAVQFGANIDKDAAEALVIGGTNATVVQFGVGLDADAAQALVIGATNATSVQFGTGIDKDAAEALVIGATNATSVQFGTAIDKDAAEQLDIGITNATAVRVQDILIDATVIDTNGAAVLSIGTSNATAITIGDVGVITTVAGDLNVTGDEQVTGSTTFLGDTTIGDASTDTLTITASVDSDINFVGPQQLTTSSGDMKFIPEGTTIAQGGLGVALTFTNYTTSGSTLTGTGTAFNTELQVGDSIEVDLDGGTTVDIRRVTAIAGATSLTVNAAFTSDVGPVTHGLNKDDNLFEVYTGYGDARLSIGKNGATTLTRGAINEPVLSLTNAEDADTAKIYVVDDDPPVVVGAANGDIALSTTGKFFWYGGAAWNEAGTSTPTALQGAYDQQVGVAVQLADGTGDWIVETDDTGTAANWIIRNEGATANYFATDSAGAAARVADSGLAAYLDGQVAGLATNDGGTTYMMNLVAPSSAITVNANTTTFDTTTAAKTITGNGTNTLTVAGTTGGLNLTATTAPMNIQTTTGLLTITTTNGDIDIAPSGTGTVYVQNASNEGLQIDDTGEVTILGGGATVSISDGSGATGITLTGATGAIAVDNSGVADVSITVNAADDLSLQAASNTTGTGAVNIGTTAADQVNVGTSGGNEPAIDINGTTVAIDGSTSISIGTTADKPIDVDSTTFDLDASGALTLTATGAAATLETVTSGQLNITAADNLVMSGDTVTIDANNTNGFSVDGTAASNVSVTSGNLTLSTITSGTLAVTSVAALDMDGTVVTLDGSTSVAIDSAGTTLLDSATGTTVSADAGGVTIDATAGNIAITAPAASDVAITATDNAGSDITFQAHGSAVIEFNGTTTGDTGDKDLASTFTATNIIGALNELKADAGEFTLSRVTGTGGVVAGNAVYIDSTDTNRVRKSDADAAASSRIVGFARTTQAITEAVLVDTQGEVTVSSDISAAAQGAYVYLSGTAGEVTATAPGSGTVLRVGIITDVGTGAGDGKILIQVGTPVSL